MPLKKQKHQPKYIRAVFERVTLRLAFLALLGSILFSGFRFYQGRQQNVNAANEVKQQSDHKKASAQTKKESKQWYDYRAVAHALGEIDGKEYTNSKDAFFKFLSKRFQGF